MMQHSSFLIFKGLWYMFLVFYVCWVLFLAVMNLKASRDGERLSRPAYYLGSPLLMGGLLLDCVINLVALTILGLELPQEGTITYRLSRWKKVTDAQILAITAYRDFTFLRRLRQCLWLWRRGFATYICTNFLDGFDDGQCHCK